MKAITKIMITACLLQTGIAHSALISTLSFTDQTGLVKSGDSFDVWVTLTLDSTSEALVFDPSAPLSNLPESFIPTVGEYYEPLGYDPIISEFVSYTHVFTTAGYGGCGGSATDNLTCNNNDNGFFDFSHSYSTPQAWSRTNSSITLNPGESRDFLIAEVISPNVVDGVSLNYVLPNAGISIVFFGLDATGNEISKSVYLGYTCATLDESCYFTRTVSAVPVPSSIWLLASGMIGLIALRKRKSFRHQD